MTEEHRKNLKKALMGIKNPMFGRLHSKFIKRKIGKNSTKKNIFWFLKLIKKFKKIKSKFEDNSF